MREQEVEFHSSVPGYTPLWSSLSLDLRYFAAETIPSHNEAMKRPPKSIESNDCEDDWEAVAVPVSEGARGRLEPHGTADLDKIRSQ